MAVHNRCKKNHHFIAQIILFSVEKLDDKEEENFV
jgi:hypothetical protein